MDIIAKLNNKYQIQPEITASYFTQTYCELGKKTNFLVVFLMFNVAL